MIKKALLLNGCLWSFAVFADEAVIEIAPITVEGSKTVRASFNTEAVSKNTLTGTELTERGINGIDEISQRIANFHLTSQGTGSFTQRFSMRGLTNTAIFSPPAAVFYVDDVPYSDSIATMGRLLNISSQDVYRSAQPGRFGKNAYAGAVDIKTRQPENKLSAGVSLELGNYDSYQVRANISGGLVTDQLFFSLNGEFQQRDGFLYNSYLNTRPDAVENFSGRAALKWTPNHAWDVRLTFSRENFNYGASRYVRLDSPDFFTVRSEVNEKLKQRADSQALRIAYHADNYELLSISSRRFWQMAPLIADFNLLPTLFTRFQDSTETAWTQEFRLQPKHNNGDWQWHIGLFYSDIAKHSSSDAFLPTSYTRNESKKRTIDNYAGFAQLSYQGIKDIKAFLDLRMDYVRNTVDAYNFYLPRNNKIVLQQADTNIFISPKFGIDYTFSPQLLVYAATGRGFKPSGFALPAFYPVLSHFYKETSWQNEIGMKTNWFNNQFKLNVAGFYYAIKNYQIERGFASGDYATINAPKAHSYGFEVESQAKIMDNLWLETNLGYTHIQFDRYRDPITHVDYAGKVAPFVPDFTSTVALQYKHPDGYFGRAEWLWTGRTFFDENNTKPMHQNDYSVGNIRLGYEQKNYSIYAFVNNLTDTRYYTIKFVDGRGAPGAPRVIGAQLAVNF